MQPIVQNTLKVLLVNALFYRQDMTNTNSTQSAIYHTICTIQTAHIVQYTVHLLYNTHAKTFTIHTTLTDMKFIVHFTWTQF